MRTKICYIEMLTDVGDKMWWGLLYDVCYCFGHFGNHTIFTQAGTNIQKMLPTSKFTRQHPEIVTNIIISGQLATQRIWKGFQKKHVIFSLFWESGEGSFNLMKKFKSNRGHELAPADENNFETFQFYKPFNQIGPSSFINPIIVTAECIAFTV